MDLFFHLIWLLAENLGTQQGESRNPLKTLGINAKVNFYAHFCPKNLGVATKIGQLLENSGEKRKSVPLCTVWKAPYFVATNLHPWIYPNCYNLCGLYGKMPSLICVPRHVQACRRMKFSCPAFRLPSWRLSRRFSRRRRPHQSFLVFSLPACRISSL